MSKTKIDERREREEYDRKNPWRPMSEPIEKGRAVELLFSDMETSRDRHFFLDGDGTCYEVDPPRRLTYGHGWYGGRMPMNWRPTNRKIGPSKRASIIAAANKRD